MSLEVLAGTFQATLGEGIAVKQHLVGFLEALQPREYI